MNHIPEDHPRAQSLRWRERITQGVTQGITSTTGLIAHGRGETFDYLLGEQTHAFAQQAIDAAAVALRAATHPVLSVNGNVAALAPGLMAELAKVLGCPLEVNLFHHSAERIERIKQHLLHHGAAQVLTPHPDCVLPHLSSARRHVHPEGIYRADVVLVPLEDGDRTEALVKNGKRVITIDLNPLSRTAQTANITIVDHLNRALPRLIRGGEAPQSDTPKTYDNQAVLAQAEKRLRGGINN